jgi:signal peptidase II
LIVMALVIVVALAIWLTRTPRTAQRFAIAAVIAGAIGNVIDRARFGAVVDFLDFHAMGYHWPAFNIADCAVVVGIAILMIDSLFFEPKEQNAPDRKQTE